MPVDPAISELAGPIEEGRPWPRPHCPVCDRGYIQFEQPRLVESPASGRDHVAFEPEWIRGTFDVRGECDNPDCKQSVHGAGKYNVAYARASAADDPWSELQEQYAAYFSVAYMYPPLRLMPIPASAPEALRDGVIRAAQVLFADPGLAANALRAVVERFLTSEGFPPVSTSGRFLNLQRRLAAWRLADPARVPIADLISAVRWIGNAGSHEESDLTANELVTGASLLDEAFHRIYTGPDLDSQAQSINRAKGPSRHV
jgi:hypothetical protein